MCKVLQYASLRNAACAAALLAAPFIVSPEAYAEETWSGWYVSGSAGAEVVEDSDFESTSGVDVRKGESTFDPGHRLSGAFGYGWNNIRAEGEISWRRIEMDSIEYDHFTARGTPLPGALVDSINNSVSADGTGTMLVLMANAWYDLDTGTDWAPYIGGGLGMAKVKFDVDVSLTIPPLAPGASPISRSISGDDADWVFAYQIGAGIGYRLSDSVVIQSGYRFMRTSDLELKWDDGSTVESKVEAHGFEVGVRYRF